MTLPNPCPHSDELGLAQAAGWLRDRYHRQTDLVTEQRGWNLRLALLASDAPHGATLQLVDGRIAAISGSDSPSDRAPSPPPGPPCDVVIQGPLALLRDILLLRQAPSEPYLFGDLIVQGTEPDFLRLDYIVSTLAQRLLDAPA